jgi:hypothetical protein
MRKIYDGPRSADGESLWYGLRPGTESWGNSFVKAGLCLTTEVEGELRPVGFPICEAWMRWVAGDPSLTLADLNYARFEELTRRGIAEFSEVATDDPDLSGLRDNSAKLLLSHGVDDELILADGSLNYYKRPVDALGGVEATRAFARLFLTDGDDHGSNTAGPGLTVAAGMIALMNWVENGVAPDEITAVAVNPQTGAVRATRPAYAYPMSPRYRGSGDPNDASSFFADKVE